MVRDTEIEPVIMRKRELQESLPEGGGVEGERLLKSIQMCLSSFISRAHHLQYNTLPCVCVCFTEWTRRALRLPVHLFLVKEEVEDGGQSSGCR